MTRRRRGANENDDDTRVLMMDALQLAVDKDALTSQVEEIEHEYLLLKKKEKAVDDAWLKLKRRAVEITDRAHALQDEKNRLQSERDFAVAERTRGHRKSKHHKRRTSK
jgi:hypothetical protein